MRNKIVPLIYAMWLTALVGFSIFYLIKFVHSRSQSHVILSRIDILNFKTRNCVGLNHYCICRVMTFSDVIKPITFIHFDMNYEFIRIFQVREH